MMDRVEGALLVAELALSETRSLAERVLHLGENLPAGLPGERGADGKDADPEVIRAMVADAVAQIPPPKDGAPGQDGKDVDPEFVRTLVAGTVADVMADVVATLPVPQDGAPGAKGDPGMDGKDVDPELVRALVAEAVAEAVAAIPAPKDGEPGRKGDPADIVFLPEDLAFEVADCVKFLHESPDIRQYERETRWTAHGGTPGPARNVVFERDEHQRIVGARLMNGDAA